MLKKISLILLIPLLLAGCGQTDEPLPGKTREPVAKPPIEAEEQDTNLFIAIHTEPGTNLGTTKYPEEYWPAMVALVESADKHDMKLNILFQVQWGLYILEDESRLELVREWEANGHEIGMHYHGLGHGNWNGYTNNAEYFDDFRFQGTVDEMMDIMNQIPASGQIDVECMTLDDMETDHPQGVAYDVNGGADKFGDLWSTPESDSFNGQDVTMLRHARYGASFNEVNIDLEQMSQLLTETETDEIWGLVFHGFEYAESPNAFDALFTLLETNGIYSQSVPDMLN